VSLLETTHAAVGLVRSGVSANLTQWCGRAHALFMVAEPFRQALKGSMFPALMLMIWGIGEAIRYPWCESIRRHI
jgi:formate hydrogenlyase subunit 4